MLTSDRGASFPSGVDSSPISLLDHSKASEHTSYGPVLWKHHRLDLRDAIGGCPYIGSSIR